MYHAHFGLKEEPFGVTPDCRFFYQSDQHKESLASLYYAVRQRRGFALLIGRAGLGKTSVLVQLVQLLEEKAATAYLPHPFYDRSTLLETVLLSFGVEPTPSLAQNHRLFFKFLTEQRLAGKTCVVIFDEAQDLNYDTLEAIRMLSNFETPTEKLVQIILSGQPHLAETLARPAYEQLRQRMNVVARLEPLDSGAIHGYIEHRLQTAGGSSRLFAPEALQSIASASGGVPRNVNTLCFNSLTLAFASNHSRVGVSEVMEALQDLDLSAEAPSPLPSSIPAPAPPPPSPWPARFFRPAFIAAGILLLAVSTLFVRGFLWAR